ncbi:hypothetical protein BJY04DRAFT_54486 [Aspergillus karnatakaensis]|uniref:uncharacterized protein n=1 Tax=Aspergillus karnatakaensis TaxID=1810916 RepID=UPI003CCE21BB
MISELSRTRMAAVGIGIVIIRKILKHTFNLLLHHSPAMFAESTCCGSAMGLTYLGPRSGAQRALYGDGGTTGHGAYGNAMKQVDMVNYYAVLASLNGEHKKDAATIQRFGVLIEDPCKKKCAGPWRQCIIPHEFAFAAKSSYSGACANCVYTKTNISCPISILGCIGTRILTMKFFIQRLRRPLLPPPKCLLPIRCRRDHLAAMLLTLWLRSQ